MPFYAGPDQNMFPDSAFWVEPTNWNQEGFIAKEGKRRGI